MFMRSWNKKIIIGVGLIVVQVIIFMAISKRENANFTIPSFIICCVPGLIGAFLIWLERSKGRF